MRLTLTRRWCTTLPKGEKNALLCTHARTYAQGCGGGGGGVSCRACLNLSHSLIHSHSLSLSPCSILFLNFLYKRWREGKGELEERERTRQWGGRREEPSWIPSPIRCQSLQRRLAHNKHTNTHNRKAEEEIKKKKRRRRRRCGGDVESGNRAEP